MHTTEDKLTLDAFDRHPGKLVASVRTAAKGASQYLAYPSMVTNSQEAHIEEEDSSQIWIISCTCGLV